VLSLGIFSVATDGNMCHGVDTASKNEYQDTPGGKDGLCVRVTTLPPSSCRKSRKSGDLTYRISLGHLGLSRDTFTFLPTRRNDTLKEATNAFRFSVRLENYAVISHLIFCDILKRLIQHAVLEWATAISW
jgi:hypothetical protein